MYSVFGLIAISYLIFKNKIQTNLFWIAAILLLCVYVLLLSSKAGWIGLILWLIGLLTWLIYNKKYFYGIVLPLFLVGFFLVFNVYYTPSFSQRIPKAEVIKNAIVEKDEQNKKVTTGNDGSARRVFVWKAALEIIKQNVLVGVGTGDSKDKMLEMYQQKEMEAEYNAKLNAHNQYLNTGVSLGLIGISSLIICLFIPFYFSLKERTFVVYGFVVIVAINLLFESMFEKQAGVVFYVFFNTLLCVSFLNFKSKINISH